NPVLHRSNAVSFTAGLLLAIGALSALVAHRRDGQPEVVRVRALDAVFLLTEGIWIAYPQLGLVPSAKWNTVNFQIGPMPAADGHVMAFMGGSALETFCSVVADRPELLARPEFATADARRYHIDELRTELDDWFRSRTRDEIFEA